jgi:hypothetical protein
MKREHGWDDEPDYDFEGEELDEPDAEELEDHEPLLAPDPREHPF